MTSMLDQSKKLQKYFSSSISKKIIIPYALLTLVLAALGIFVVVQLVAGSFEERLKNQLKDAAQIVADEIVVRERTRLEIERVVANTIGVPEAVINRDTDVLNELVSPVIANAQVIDSIIMVDTQGTELIRLHRQGEGANSLVKTDVGSGADLYSWPAVQQVLSNPDGYKTVQLAVDPDSNRVIIYTVGPIRNNDGVVGAALVGTYLRNELLMLKDLALAQLVLFDDSGEVLITTFPFSSKDEEQQTFAFFTPEKYQEVMERSDITLLEEITIAEETPENLQPGEVIIKDQGYRLAFAPFLLRGENYGVYAVALPTNFITQTTTQSRNLLVAIFSFGVVTVFAVGYFVSRRISKPIFQLVKTSRAISAGNLDERTGLEREDEIGILANTFDDMTETLQHLLKVQEEEASKLNAILKSIADGVIVQDAGGNILIKNPTAETMLQEMEEDYWRQAAQDNNFVTAVSSGDIAQTSILQHYIGGLSFRETHRFEVGIQVFSALSAPVMTSDNVPLGSVVVLRDITREVEAEKLKDDFITSMSHELRTPLTAIKGYNQLLKMTAGQQLDDKQMKFVDTIGSNVDDLLEIIQQMLDLTQIDAGTLGIDHEPVNLTALIEEEVTNWLEEMQMREMSFNANLPGESVWVEGDEGRLSRVMHNLIKNAHDYTLPGGKIQVSVTQNNGRVQVDVKDTGVGISKEDQRFLFTRFFRAIHNEHTFEVSGAGLGLYTSKAIIEAHNGKMWMESEPDKGSTFSFVLSTVTPEADDFAD